MTLWIILGLQALQIAAILAILVCVVGQPRDAAKRASRRTGRLTECLGAVSEALEARLGEMDKVLHALLECAKAVAAQPPAAVVQPTAIPPNSSLHEVVARRARDLPWEHHGWVRAHTPAWQQVWDTPDEALKIDGEIVEGAQ